MVPFREDVEKRFSVWQKVIAACVAKLSAKLEKLLKRAYVTLIEIAESRNGVLEGDGSQGSTQLVERKGSPTVNLFMG